MNKKYTDKKIAASLLALSISIGGMFVADNISIQNILDEQSVLSEMANKTLNISFVPNSPLMKNHVNLFNAITQTDINNISKIQGVKSVKPVSSEYNPLGGYLKVNSKSSYIELYGMSENGDDLNRDNIEMVYGRSINSSDRGKNVIVLNMETVNDLQIVNAKSLIGTGVEINNSMYEVIGIMNVVLEDERDNTNNLEYSSLIPKSTSKEILARANAKTPSYSSITVSVEENANASAVESSIYNLLYQQHDNIDGYYERDVEYNLPKKLGPTLSMLDNFTKVLKTSMLGVSLLSLLAFVKSTFKIKRKHEYDEVIEVESNEESALDTEDKVENIEDLSNVEENNEEDTSVESKEADEEKEENKEDSEGVEKEESNVEDYNEDNVEEVEVSKSKKMQLPIEFNVSNCMLTLASMMIAVLAFNYFLSGKSVENIFEMSVWTKTLSVIVSFYLISLTKRK